jgi:hypothetical protein
MCWLCFGRVLVWIISCGMHEGCILRQQHVCTCGLSCPPSSDITGQTLLNLNLQPFDLAQKNKATTETPSCMLCTRIQTPWARFCSVWETFYMLWKPFYMLPLHPCTNNSKFRYPALQSKISV